MATLYTLTSTENRVGELEAFTGLSFQRSYLIYNVPAGCVRGQHRHRQSHSVLMCLTGSVSVFIQSADTDTLYHLTKPEQALHILPADWRVLYHFSPDCLILALASNTFSARDYVFNPYRPVCLPVQKSVRNQAVL
ncbi:hypothetical protein GCM10027299_11070 [Larkinella ripae]